MTISDGWVRVGRIVVVLAAAFATVVLVTANGQAFGPVGFGSGMADSCVPSVTLFGEIEVTQDTVNPGPNGCPEVSAAVRANALIQVALWALAIGVVVAPRRVTMRDRLWMLVGISVTSVAVRLVVAVLAGT